MEQGLSHPQPKALAYTVVLDPRREEESWTWEAGKPASVILGQDSIKTMFVPPYDWWHLCGHDFSGITEGKGVNAGLWGALAPCSPSGSLACYL